MGNKPVNFVSLWDAARFTNWLTSGNTETGVYNLGGVRFPTNDSITRDITAWNAGGVAIASADEWYKAAYYSGSAAGADGDGYWTYAHQSNALTTADANYGDSGVGTVTDVGLYSDAASYYGTFDQVGNVMEWNEAIFGDNRSLRGGSYFGNLFLQSGSQYSFEANSGSNDIGFRITSLAPIPEPSAYAAIVGMLGLSIALCRRKRRGTLLNVNAFPPRVAEGDYHQLLMKAPSASSGVSNPR